MRTFGKRPRARRFWLENDLFYADWKHFRDFCESEMSPYVTVMQDYGLAEWTIYVNR